MKIDQLCLFCGSWEEVDKEASKITTADDRVKHRLLDESLPLVANRVVFTTANGYAGLGPQGLKKGDRVCLILGAVTPFIIREKELVEKTENGKRAEVDEMFLLVGECYIHGLMGEEVMNLGEVQDITLC